MDHDDMQNWTSLEDDRLREALILNKKGTKNWREVAAHVGTKTAHQCQQRWKNTLNPDVLRIKGRWTTEVRDVYDELFVMSGLSECLWRWWPWRCVCVLNRATQSVSCSPSLPLYCFTWAMELYTEVVLRAPWSALVWFTQREAPGTCVLLPALLTERRVVQRAPSCVSLCSLAVAYLGFPGYHR